MRNAAHRMLLSLILPSLILATAAWHVAPSLAQDATPQDSKTIAVVSVASYDDMMENIAFIGALTGTPGADQQAELMINLFTQGQGLVGLDKAKSFGAIVNASDESIEPLVFLPVNDGNQLLEILVAFDYTSEELEDGIYSVKSPEMPEATELPEQDQFPELFVQTKGDWTFVARSRDALAAAPDDPRKLLGEMEENYDVAVNFKRQNLPKKFHEMVVEGLKQGMAEGLQMQPDEGTAEFEIRKKYVESVVNSLETMINDTDEVTVGWSIDPVVKTTHIDLTISALPGSKLANTINASAELKTAFGGFVAEDGAFTWTAVGKMNEDDIVQSVAMIEGLRKQAMKSVDEEEDLPDDETREVVKSAVGDLLDAATATVEAGTSDAGGSLMLNSDSLTFVAGGRVASADKVEAALRKLAGLAEKEEDFPGVQWNADKHGDVEFHTMEVSTPDEQARKIFGDSLQFSLGIGKDSLYFALGDDGVASIKSAIDRSADGAAADQPPAAVRISLGKIMQFAAQNSQDPQAMVMAALFAGTEGNDHISITANADENSVTYRLEVEEGVLQALGQATAAFSGGQAAIP